MARITKPLTNTEIEKAKPKNREYSLFDGDGLALRIKVNGSKLWIFNYYRPFTKQRTNLGLGVYPEISLSEARQIRKQYRALLAKKIDPKAHKEKLESEKILEQYNTFLHVSNLWKSKKLTEIEEKTVNKYWRSLELHVFPMLGKYPVNEIIPTMTISALKKLEAQGKFDMIQRLCATINEILNFAVNSGFIPLNPCLKINTTFRKAKKKNNPRIKSEELTELMQSLALARIEHQTRAVIKFQLLTMVRPQEASNARWSEIDFDKKIWRIPAEKMKARVSHEVPLSTQAIELLYTLKQRNSNSPYIFPKRTNLNEPMSSSTANVALKRMGYQDIQTAHGLRGLARTYLAEQGIQHEHAEACLAHKTGSNVSQAYNHATYLEQRKEIMQLWADYVEKCSTVKTV